jgi:uncharacterized protein YjiS (DUF1127 family)
MAYVAVHAASAAPKGVFAALSTLRVRIERAIRRHVEYARTLDELSQLTDRDLEDLGFLRCDLRRIAREAADTI